MNDKLNIWIINTPIANIIGRAVKLNIFLWCPCPGVLLSAYVARDYHALPMYHICMSKSIFEVFYIGNGTCPPHSRKRKGKTGAWCCVVVLPWYLHTPVCLPHYSIQLLVFYWSPLRQLGGLSFTFPSKWCSTWQHLKSFIVPLCNPK